MISDHKKYVFHQIKLEIKRTGTVPFRLWHVPFFLIKKAFDYLIKKCKSEIDVIINLHQDLQGDIISAFRQLLLKPTVSAPDNTGVFIIKPFSSSSSSSSSFGMLGMDVLLKIE